MRTTKKDKQEAFRTVDYLGRDFNTLKDDLINFCKQFYPNTYKDFNKASAGMMLLELTAYVGDILGYYLDQTFQNLFLSTAGNKENLIALAKNLGYKPRGQSASVTNTYFYIEVPADTIDGIVQPDPNYLPKVTKGKATFSSNTTPSITFSSTEEVDFAVSANREVAILNTDEFDNPTDYVVRKTVEVVAGEIIEEEFDIGVLEQFKQIKLTNPNVLEILYVRDENANDYYEVDYLAQDTIFSGFKNQKSDSDLVPYTLKLKRVPRRFTAEIDKDGYTALTFGAGTYSIIDGEQIPDPSDFVLPPSIKGVMTFAQIQYDPTNFLNTRTLGIAPANTKLFIKYRYGGGRDSNVPVTTIVNVLDAPMTFPVSDNQLDMAKKSIVMNSCTIENFEPAVGGNDEESLVELKEHAEANFPTQMRAVTLQDYAALLTRMPSEFGTVFRTWAEPSEVDRYSVTLYVLARGTDGKLTTVTKTLRSNIKAFIERYRMLTDAIELIDGEIINIGLDFAIIVDPTYNRQEILNNCIEELKNMFDLKYWDFNQSIILSQIIDRLHDVEGVVGVAKVKIVNLFENEDSRVYNDGIRWDIASNTDYGVIQSKKWAMWQIKYPNWDITGEAISTGEDL